MNSPYFFKKWYDTTLPIKVMFCTPLNRSSFQEVNAPSNLVICKLCDDYVQITKEIPSKLPWNCTFSQSGVSYLKTTEILYKPDIDSILQGSKHIQSN